MTPQRNAAGYGVRVSVMYAALFAVYGLQLPYLAVWLESLGIDAPTIGLIAAVPMLVRLVANPLVAVWADAGARHASSVVGLCVAGLAGAAVLPFAPVWVGILICVTVLMVSLQSALPLIDAVAMAGVKRLAIDYGRVRLWGSLTFILAVVIGGGVIERAGVHSFPWMLLALVAAVALAALALPSAARDGPGESTSGATAPASSRGHGLDLTQVGRLLMRSDFVLFLLANGAVQASHATYYTFSAIHWRTLGLSGDWIGVLWGLGVVAEIVLFAISAPIVARMGPLGLLALGGVAGVVRWSAMAAEPTGLVLVLLQFLHALTFGATHLAAVHFVASRIDDRQQALAQTLSATFTTGVAMAGAVFAAGLMYEAFAALSYLAMAALSVVGLTALAALSTLERSSRRAAG